MFIRDSSKRLGKAGLSRTKQWRLRVHDHVRGVQWIGAALQVNPYAYKEKTFDESYRLSRHCMQGAILTWPHPAEQAPERQNFTT